MVARGGYFPRLYSLSYVLQFRAAFRVLRMPIGYTSTMVLRILIRTTFLVSLFVFSPALRAQPGPKFHLRVAVVADPSRSASAVVEVLRKSPRFEIRPEAGKEPTAEDLETWADAVLVLSLHAGNDADWARRLEAVVESGAGLVVSGEAVCALPDSAVYASILGRGAHRPWRPQPSAVVVSRQSHPVTQCLTHFLHAGTPQAVVTERGILAVGGVPDDLRVRAQPASPGTPRALKQAALVWTHRREKVVATALDLTGGRSTGAAATILKRALEWVTSRRIRTPLESPYVLSSTLLAQSLALATESPATESPATESPATESPVTESPVTGGLAGAESTTSVGIETAFLERGFALPGRFFMGRQCAQVMTYHGADWLIRPDREQTEQPDRVLEALAIQPGDTVVDLGAGNGYFSIRMARLVGDKGRVLAVDIQPEMLKLLSERAREAGVTNIENVLATETDPRLQPESADLVLMVDVYHELATPEQVLAKVRRSLKPYGRLALVEYRGEDPTVAIKPLHRMLLPQVSAELLAQGFEVLKVHEFLPTQRIVVAGKVASGRKSVTAEEPESGYRH